MLIFYGSMIIGLLGIICSYFGLLHQFIVVFVVSLLGQLIYKKLSEKIIREEQEAAITEATQRLMYDIDKVQKQEIEKRQQLANSTDFIDKGMIPVRVDEETGAYIVNVADMVVGVEKYLERLEKEYQVRFQELGEVEIQKKPEDK